MAEQLTPQQAADVIRYYHDGENALTRARGWKDKVPLGLAALHTYRAGEHSILPDKSPTLTLAEMESGNAYLQEKTNDALHEPEISPQRQRRIDALVDGSGMSYDEAYRRTS